jgi:hypothetical protein
LSGLSVVVLLGLERREELCLAARVAGRERDGEEVLGLGDGAGAAELDDVADLELVVGVVGLELLLDALAALVLGVRRQAHHLHTHRLVRLGRHHPPSHLLRCFDAKLHGGASNSMAEPPPTHRRRGRGDEGGVEQQHNRWMDGWPASLLSSPSLPAKPPN